MAEQVLGRYVNTEASKGDVIITRHVTEVNRLTNDHIVALWCPEGENNLSVADDDSWYLRVEGFEPATDYPIGWFVSGTYFAGQTIRTDAKGIAEVSGTIGALIAAGLPAPDPAGTSMLSAAVGDYRSEPVKYAP